MKSTHQDYFDKTIAEWAAADAECRRLYVLWNEACIRQRKLAKIKNQAWRELNAATLAEYDRERMAPSVTNGERK